MRGVKLGINTKRAIDWSRTSDPEFPFSALVDGETWVVRVNDFPEEVLYTLLIAGREVANFNDWPPAWRRPTLTGTESDPTGVQSPSAVQSQRSLH